MADHSMLAPRTRLGSQSRYSTAGRSTPMGGMLREVSNRVSHLNAEKAPLEMTFGVETEFLLLGRIPIPLWVGDNKYPARMVVYHALTDTPVYAACATCGQTHSFTLPVASPFKDTGDSFSEIEWSVTHDVSVQPTSSDIDTFLQSLRERELGMQADMFWGMELRSRPLQLGKNLRTADSTTDTYHRHEVTIEQEVTLMLEKLHDAFNTIEGCRGTKREEIRLAVNSTCGLHVHVGNGVRSRGFPLSTVKSLQQVYTANERSIDSIQSSNRITGTTYAIRPFTENPGMPDRRIPGHKAYNQANSEFFINSAFSLLHYEYLGSTTGREPAWDVYPFKDFGRPEVANAAYSFRLSGFLGLIENARSIVDLRYLNLGGEHHNTLNFQNLLEFNPAGHGSGKVTIEFRQHAGSIGAADILPWVDFVTKMVGFAHDSSPAKMRAHLDKVLSDPSYDVINLLNELACEPSTIHHYSHVLGRTSTGENYAQARLEKQSYKIDQMPAAQDITNRMRHMMAKTNAAALLPANVQARVDMKFRLGGYGRFSEAYLDGYRPRLSEAEKYRLTDGNVLTSSTGLTDRIMNEYASNTPVDPEDLALTPTSGGQ